MRASSVVVGCPGAGVKQVPPPTEVPLVEAYDPSPCTWSRTVPAWMANLSETSRWRTLSLKAGIDQVSSTSRHDFDACSRRPQRHALAAIPHDSRCLAYGHAMLNARLRRSVGASVAFVRAVRSIRASDRDNSVHSGPSAGGPLWLRNLSMLAVSNRAAFGELR